MTDRQHNPGSEDSTSIKREVYHRTDSEHPDAADTAAADVSRELYREQVASPAGNVSVRSERVSVPSAAARNAVTAERIRRVGYFVVGAIAVLLGARFVLLLLGASEASGFVQMIYSLSTPFMLPFVGIFGEPSFGSSVVEWASLVAIIVYLLVGYGISRLVDVIYAPVTRTSSV